MNNTLQRRQTLCCTVKKNSATSCLGVVDGARPGVSGGEDGGGGVASNVASNAGVSLDFGVGVGAHLDGAGPVLGDGGGDVVEEGGKGADVLEHFGVIL